MKSFRDRYPVLDQFFGGYFHQDWEDVLPEGSERTSAGVLKQAFEEHLHWELLELQRILRDFLSDTAALDDEALGDVLTSAFGSYYYAPWDGSTYRSWLESIDKQLDEAIVTRMRIR